MTPELFKDLALEFAELHADDLRLLTIREHYGFVDLMYPEAMSLIKNLNGIEYNGQVLPIEFATVINKRQPNRAGRKNFE